MRRASLISGVWSFAMWGIVSPPQTIVMWFGRVYTQEYSQDCPTAWHGPTSDGDLLVAHAHGQDGGPGLVDRRSQVAPPAQHELQSVWFAAAVADEKSAAEPNATFQTVDFQAGTSSACRMSQWNDRAAGHRLKALLRRRVADLGSAH